MIEQLRQELQARRNEFEQIKEKANSISTQITQLLTEISWLNNPQEDSLKLAKGILFRIKKNQFMDNDFGYTRLKTIQRGSENYPPLIEELVVNLLGTCERVIELMREKSELKHSALFRMVSPRNQEDIRKIDSIKHVIINLNHWPATEEFVLDLRSRSNFIVLYRNRNSPESVRVRLLNATGSRMVANLSDNIQDFIEAWKEKKLPNLATIARSQVRIVYGEKITMIGNVTSSSGSDSSPNTQIRGGNHD